jgi:hypothetical protein
VIGTQIELGLLRSPIGMMEYWKNGHAVKRQRSYWVQKRFFLSIWPSFSPIIPLFHHSIIPALINEPTLGTFPF